MNIKTKINDVALSELWTHMLEYVCLYRKDIYLHPFYNFDANKEIGYFYNGTKERTINKEKYKLLPDFENLKGFKAAKNPKGFFDHRTIAIIFFLINNKLGECLYDATRDEILYIFEGSQENIQNLFDIPRGTKITFRQTFDQSLSGTGIPPRLFLFAKLIDILEKRRRTQHSIVDTLSILGPIFTKSLELSEAYRKMKR